MIFVRKMVMVCLKNNILFRAKHIPGHKNVFADSLSRLQIQRFQQLANTDYDQTPTTIPGDLLPMNWQI